MRVETIEPDDGDGAKRSPIAAVGGVHGDEPCGVRAIDRFLETDLRDRIRRPVKLIVANEAALAAGDRFLESDLNRSFPGDPNGDAHEERLAHDLLREIEDCFTLGFHATVSDDRPFGTLADPTPRKARVMRALPLDHAADFTGVVEGRSVTLPGFVNVEAGYQGSDAAADNAFDCLVAFLRATDALPGDVTPSPTGHFRVRETIEKPPGRSYRVHVENFERVPAGTTYATVDDRELRAAEPFRPVLLSADGHDTLLGYAADRVGQL
ncbi:M14 family metallopeptidase [Halopenitus persicus]|uniref:Succinylglutamate desuccinylase n=1 Tax=Halopenitus persicus TaxID=1048396 RepID=A0A1H3GUS6_9EURY|nr:succinylglutamate desuccinylase/aspartoacylase family protein [Halopenitus persicus]QHS17402.1 succinylglutamate desuccinylase [haloarchaeon 3A1-DGR]SDY06867.1 Succinylglutamate desuccinylase [Halopenitus persicus]